MAKKRKAAKKTARKQVKTRARRAASGQKRQSAAATRSKPPQEMSFIDHFLKIFATPETGKRNGR